MKSFRKFATFVHFVSLFLILCAGLVALMGLVPNKPLAWIIFLVAFASYIPTAILFFSRGEGWYMNNDALEKEIVKLQEERNNVSLLKNRYLAKLDMVDSRYDEINKVSKSIKEKADHAEKSFIKTMENLATIDSLTTLSKIHKEVENKLHHELTKSSGSDDDIQYSKTDNYKKFETPDQLRDALEGSKHNRIVYDKDDVIVIEVSSHLDIRQYATHRWAIVNKKFYDAYVNDRYGVKGRQYLAFNFNRNIDDDFRLVGLTDYPNQSKLENVAHTPNGNLVTDKVCDLDWYKSVAKNTYVGSKD
jgi:hypothetical protein